MLKCVSKMDVSKMDVNKMVSKIWQVKVIYFFSVYILIFFLKKIVGADRIG